MCLVDKMPELMLEPVRPPIVCGKQVPSVFVHQVAVDFSLVIQFDEELVEDPIDLARGIDLSNVQLVRPEPGLDFLKDVCRISKIAAAPGRQEIRYHHAV